MRIRATVEEVGATSLGYAFVFEKDRAGRWTEVARGRMTTIHVRKDAAARMEAEPMPEPVRAAFDSA